MVQQPLGKRFLLRRLLVAKGAWDGIAPYARRAAKRLVDIALESERFDAGLEDVFISAEMTEGFSPRETIAAVMARAASLT